MNFLYTSNAKKGPHKAFNAYKEFCGKELDGLNYSCNYDPFQNAKF